MFDSILVNSNGWTSHQLRTSHIVIGIWVRIHALVKRIDLPEMFTPGQCTRPLYTDYRQQLGNSWTNTHFILPNENTVHVFRQQHTHAHIQYYYVNILSQHSGTETGWHTGQRAAMPQHTKCHNSAQCAHSVPFVVSDTLCIFFSLSWHFSDIRARVCAHECSCVTGKTGLDNQILIIEQASFRKGFHLRNTATNWIAVCLISAGGCADENVL